MLGINTFSGTIGYYTSMLKLQSKWEQKQTTKNYTQKSNSEQDSIIQQLDALKEQNQKSYSKDAIINKMNSGKKLSQQELEYLQQEDPAAYQKAKEIEAEKEGYKRALKNCKTKEDVQRLKANHLGSVMVKVGAIANDPNIPDGKKMEILLHENAKLEAINKIEKKFVQSLAYKNLPTDAERKEELEQELDKLKKEPDENKVEKNDVALEEPIVQEEEESDMTSDNVSNETSVSKEEDVSEEIKQEQAETFAFTREKDLYRKVASAEQPERPEKLDRKA